MNFTVISENSSLNSTSRLLSEAQLLGLNPNHISLYESSVIDLHVKETTKSQEIIFHRTTGIRFDDYDLNFSIKRELEGSSIFNPIESLATLRDKERQTLMLSSRNIPIIPTFSFRGRPSHELIDQLNSCFGNLSKKNQFIVKAIRGNQGIGVSIINGTDSLLSVLETFWGIKDQKFLIQPFIEAREFRYFICKNKILAIIEKSTSKDFRKNSMRSSGVIVPTSTNSELNSVALNCFNNCNLLYAGIDLLMNKDGIYILEVNPVPGFKQVEELAKINIAKILIQDALEIHNEKKQH